MTERAAEPAFRSHEELDRRRVALAAFGKLQRIDARAVRELRYDLFRGDAIGRDEADALFEIERTRPDCPEWSEFFVDTILDYLLWQQRPSAMLNEPKAEWLMGQVDRPCTLAAFALLVAVLEEAQRTPGWFLAAVRGRASKGWAAPEIARAA